MMVVMVRAFVLWEASPEKNLTMLQLWNAFLQEAVLLLHFAFVVQLLEVVAFGLVSLALWLVFPVSQHPFDS